MGRHILLPETHRREFLYEEQIRFKKAAQNGDFSYSLETRKTFAKIDGEEEIRGCMLYFGARALNFVKMNCFSGFQMFERPKLAVL